MDLEGAMEFILEQQAKAEASHARTEAALARLAERQEEAEARQVRTEATLRRAIAAGVKEARRARERDRVLDEKIALIASAQADEKITQLAAAQLVTEEKLQALIDSMNRGGDGRH